MKLITIIVAFVFGICQARCQDRESDKIYWTALDAYTHYLDSSFNRNNANGQSVTKRAIYLKKQDYIDSLPERMNGYPVILLTETNYKKLYRDHQKSLIQTEILPLKVMDSLLQITIIPYHGKLKANHLRLGVSDGVDVVFYYHCEKRRFLLKEVKGWGI